jgi:hypothetical protein
LKLHVNKTKNWVLETLFLKTDFLNDGYSKISGFGTGSLIPNLRKNLKTENCILVFGCLYDVYIWRIYGLKSRFLKNLSYNLALESFFSKFLYILTIFRRVLRIIAWIYQIKSFVQVWFHKYGQICKEKLTKMWKISQNFLKMRECLQLCQISIKMRKMTKISLNFIVKSI